MDRMPVIDLAATGLNIARLRVRAGLRVRDLQDIFGFGTPQAIYKWQRGDTLPTVDNLAVLAVVFGVKIDDILVFEENDRRAAVSA
ncbi:MAG: helix-turn-helix transcriptional regulator [Oscillospiraceae bacterium]|nr:helix-turn-helix transcriptional regulator [Oscillospiraceae bacterium]